MATTAPKKATRPAAKRRARPLPKRTDKTLSDYVQHAIREIDDVRKRATVEVREGLDSAVDRLRDVATDLRTGAERESAELEKAFEDATEEARREHGRRAIMAQRTPDALTEMTAAIRERRAELKKGAAK